MYSQGSVKEAIQEIVKLIRSTLDGKNLKIELYLPRLWSSYSQFKKFDKRRLQQVLLNLLLNAVKFTPKGIIKVDANLYDGDCESDEYLLNITVEDNGIGISW